MTKLMTIPYMGSKAKLLNFIENSLTHYLKSVDEKRKQKSFFDAFSGSGQVAYHFKDKFDIITNDIQSFTKVINDTFLSSNANQERINFLIDELNNLPELFFYETDGWFTMTYSKDFLDGSAVAEDGLTNKIWLTKNARKIDMVRTKIDLWVQTGEITEDEKNVLLTSLIRAVSLVSNTCGHQFSYLKKWSKQALNDLVLVAPELTKPTKNHTNYSGDIFDVISDVNADIAYFDVPYGTNNKKGSPMAYKGYYHLYNTLVKNDRPAVFGKASRPISTRSGKDKMEQHKKDVVMGQFVELIQRCSANYVCFSYSTQGFLSPDDFKKVFEIGGCDMDSFKIYYTNHQKNKQAKAAFKNGVSIDRENQDDELLEMFIIAKKPKLRVVSQISNEDRIKLHLEHNKTNHVVSDKDYAVFYDKETDEFSEVMKVERTKIENKVFKISDRQISSFLPYENRKENYKLLRMMYHAYDEYREVFLDSKDYDEFRSHIRYKDLENRLKKQGIMRYFIAYIHNQTSDRLRYILVDWLKHVEEAA